MSIVNTTPTVRLHHNDSYNTEREWGDFGVRGSHGSRCRGRWWQMDIHPPCLCPLEELPRGKMHWRREAEAKPLWRGSCQALPVMRGNAYKCASWPTPSDSPSHTCAHTHQTWAGNRTFFSLLFFLFGGRKWFEVLWTTVQTHLTVTCAMPRLSLHARQFVCHAWQDRAHMIRASHSRGLQVQGSKKQNHDRYEPWSIIFRSSHHIEEVLQLAFSAISTLARGRLMSFTDNKEWDCGGR